MDNENHKSTWNNFTKFVLWGSIAVATILILMAIFSIMIIGSIKENLEKEQRIAITPDVVKKYKSLGLALVLPENYGFHLGITDQEFKNEGAEILESEDKVLDKSDLIIQMNFINAERSSKLKKDQLLVESLKSIRKR